ncbi:PE-PGRS family protein PE_PGRS30 [Drosophila innubila]|uniref:PE-PGRS family protein PE_PGRS30 n=1 Tax=Drosophila innubila TaxID=198719 RepID=UPI00148CAF09|nr:PE-PGRS family protein PE_PGRS30 [Drosophila innubila]
MNLSICMLILAIVCLAATSAAPQQRQRNEKQVQEGLPANGATIIEEVVLESNLHIKPKARQNVRRVRSALETTLNGAYAAHKRVKRQRKVNAGTQAGAGRTQSGVNVGVGPNGGTADAHVNLKPLGPLGSDGYRQEQTASNGAASGTFNGGSSAAIGQAQGFQSQGANGSFGGTSASTATQSQNPFGNSNSAGASHSLGFILPDGQQINFASTNSFANNGLNSGASRGGAVSVSG